MARDFNGSTDYITTSGITGDPSSTGFSFATWIYTGFASSSSTVRGVFDWQNSGVGHASDNLRARLNYGDYGTGVFAFDAQTAYAFTCAPSFGSGEWHHIGFVRHTSGNGAQFYWDGATISTTSLADSSTANNTSGFPAYIGLDSYNSGRVWLGRIAEAALWATTQLTDAHMAALGRGFRPSAVGVLPTAYWPLLGRYSPEIELVGRAEGTLTGTSAADHCRVIYPRRRWAQHVPAAAVAGNPWFYYANEAGAA